MIRFLHIAACLLFAGPAGATPPSAIDLRYDAASGKLVIDVKHASSDLNGHYIRRILVHRNADAPLKVHLNRQASAGGFTHSVPLAAVSGDRVRVEAFCRKGGHEETTLIIP